MTLPGNVGPDGSISGNRCRPTKHPPAPLASTVLGATCVHYTQHLTGNGNELLSLLEEWRGVRDEALSTLSGIPGCVFVHASGFIGGNRTQEGALEMARRTLQAAAKAAATGTGPQANGS
ncbi:hypothetical protein JZ751_021172 [Albula glossodonta]|uniref:Uncharacterized protein n=1 Tax=Albula glossodonta TaxID=121402 RepID=A0A8T2NLR5_9TELE|nr:hypothetical protein JZ751_021172 [Albula glossodonta]